MSAANFKPKRIFSALRGFLVTARLSCFGLGLTNQSTFDEDMHEK